MHTSRAARPPGQQGRVNWSNANHYLQFRDKKERPSGIVAFLYFMVKKFNLMSNAEPQQQKQQKTSSKRCCYFIAGI